MNTGDYLGRYRIVRKIGEGGMGEVFLAEDQKLNRQIAVKVLSADFASDSDRMMRFVHEAISASALNHPNIITIYEINDENEPPFIAMEFVEGETLGRRMKTSPLEIHETLDIAVQIATALAAAHEASVVHRDVKPDNVILRPDGLVKVLDFGLAKQVSRQSVSSSGEAYTIPNPQTHPGLVMGTVAYMSPEQARGKMVDARSDIFSFGAMLYQMASGRLPFIGENDIDVVGSILHKEPRPLSRSARPIPHDVELLIRKSLRKNREERYQTMRELLADLKEIREDLRLSSGGNGYRSGGGSNGNSAGELSEVERGMPTEKMQTAAAHSTQELSMAPSTLSGILMSEIKAHPVKSLCASILVTLLIGGLFYGVYKMAENWRHPEAFQTMKLEKLTFSGNVAQDQAAVSPDGKYVAFVQEEAQEQSLWVKQSVSDSAVRIIEPSGKRYSGLSFSPDGNRVYFTVVERERMSSLYQVPTLGGPARKIVDDAKGPVSFSPDGKSILFVRGETSLMAANSDGTAIREIARSGANERWLRGAWSPRGERIAATYFSADESADNIALIDPDTGARHPVGALTWYRIRGISWTPDEQILVSARDREIQYAQIWMVDPFAGTRKRVTNDLSAYQGISLTSDGRSIVSTQQNTLSNIWVNKGSGDPVRVTAEIGKSDGMSGVAFVPDGRILYTTRIKGNIDIWIINADGTGNKQLTFNAGENFSPVATPDGRSVVFVSTRGGDPSLWKMHIDGNDQTALTSDPGIEAEPAITPDGQAVIYHYTDKNNGSSIRKISVNGGESAELLAEDAGYPALSAAGDLIVCEYGSAGKGGIKIAIFRAAGGPPVKIFESPAMVRSRLVRFSADGRSLIYIDGDGRSENLWSQPIDGGDPKRITDFAGERIFRFDISRSGQMVFARGSDTSDVVMISDFR